MEQVFNSIDSDILVVSKGGIILFCNKILLRKLRYKREELEGNNVNKLLSLQDSVSKDIFKNLDGHLENKVPLILCSKNGDKNSFVGNINLEQWKCENAFFITLKNEIKETYTKDNLENLLDAIPYSIWIKDVEGKYVYTNRTHSDLMGQDKFSIMGHCDSDFCKKEECYYFDEMDNAVIKSKMSIMDQKQSGIIDSKQWFEIYKAPMLDYNDEVKYVMGIAIDITLSKKIESELAKSHNELNTLNNLVNSNVESDKGIFDNIKDDLISKLCVDGMSIWIYDDKKGKLVSKLNIGKNKEIIDKAMNMSITREVFEENFKEWTYGHLTSIEERKDLDLELLRQANVKYIGTYLIKFNNKLIGVMNILYENDNPSGFKKDDFVKTICNQIAILIVNDSLTEGIKTELSKRAETERELELFLDTAAELMAMVDYDGKFIKVNPGWTTNLGWSEEEILSMKWDDILVPEDAAPTLEFVKGLKEQGNVGRYTNRYICKNGEIRWLEWNSRYVEDRKISVCTARDITKQKEAEEQQANFQKAIEVERIKSEFFANISHEFKTPLNIILATMQLINRNIDNNRVIDLDGVNIKKYMTSIKQNSYRLLRLVNNLIDMTRIDTGFYDIHLENQNIVNVVEDITISVAQYTEDKGIELIFDTEVEEQIIACDPDKIERIMLNLLSNAIKYTGKQGRIVVELNIKDNNIVISVKDNGEGIEKDKLDLIFNRFIQVDSPLTRKGEGSGIGLSLVKSLVEMHGGTIKVASELGIGTTFEFKLPIRILEDKENTVSMKDIVNSKVEKCNIEFSDIYN